MKQKDLDVNKCHLCGSSFIEGDSVCTISKGSFDELSQHCVVEVVRNLILGINIRMEIHFHQKCFEQIAGKEYMP
jgi:hypothetical protein